MRRQRSLREPGQYLLGQSARSEVIGRRLAIGGLSQGIDQQVIAPGLAFGRIGRGGVDFGQAEREFFGIDGGGGGFGGLGRARTHDFLPDIKPPREGVARLLELVGQGTV